MSLADQPKPAGARRRAVPGFLGFGLAVALVWLAGQMVRQGVSDDNLDRAPVTAVLWGGDSADALTALARQRLVARDDRRAALYARRALQHAPLDEAALAIYGAAQEGLGQTALADRVMTLAGQRSWRDLTAQVWLFLHRLREKRYVEGFEHADALLRREPEAPPVVVEILATAARDPAAIPALASRLALAPEWRSGFFGILASDPRQPTSTAFALMQSLARGPTPPTDQEIGLYLKRLIADGRYAEAREAWRAFTGAPAQAPLVSNGAFEHAPGPSPFDWSLGDGVGWSARIAQAPGEGRGGGLVVDYDGVSPPLPVQQLLVLAPGSYRLSGELLSDSQGSLPPLVWTVVCADSGQTLARASFLPGAPSQWRPFTVDLAVPASGCAAQWLRLTADPGEIHADSTVWYDNLQVVPETPANAVESAVTGPADSPQTLPSP